VLDDEVAAVADDNDEVQGLEGRGGLDDMADERAARHRVQHLRGRGSHALALACSEDDDDGRTVHGHCHLLGPWADGRACWTAHYR